eukprot:TRINITY_DN217_c2_g1_i5.p1 TRINITY_DN217_c2_g1~~TRINITY_DN217_c2_g1_i5.p1  ORF type:complete len:1257 (+),score=397.27 TRINITY_DN217_c2_g1_i5:553-3771(+)
MEVAGTRVYDSRRAESMKILEETKTKRQRIEEHIAEIGKRIEDLSEERDELEKFHRLDSERSAIEYAIADMRLSEAREKLELVEEERLALLRDGRESFESSTRRQERVRELEDKLRGHRAKIHKLGKEKVMLDDDRQAYVRQKARQELSLEEVQEVVQRDGSLQTQWKAEKISVMREVEECKKQLLLESQALSRLQSEESSAIEECMEAEKHLNELSSKRGRGDQFQSVAERDAWLQQEIRKLRLLLKDQKERVRVFSEEISKDEVRVTESEREIRAREESVTEHIKGIEDASRRLVDLTKERDRIQTRLRDREIELDSVRTSLNEFEREKTKYLQSLFKSTGRDIVRGIESVKLLAKEHHVEGYFGCLMDLFTCEPFFFSAVETTAKNALFNIVVDNDDTAAWFLRKMDEKDLPGRVTFIPLNQLRKRGIDGTCSRMKNRLPEQAEDMIVLASRLSYDASVSPAIEQVFGRTVVVKSLEIGVDAASRYHVDCVTLDGDTVNKRGAMSGGFREFGANARMFSVSKIRDMDTNIAELMRKKELLTEEVEEGRAALTKVVGDLERGQRKKVTMLEMVEVSRIETRALESERKKLVESIQEKKKQVEEAEASIGVTEGKIEALESEVGTVLSSRLSKKEREKYAQLVDILPKLRSAVVEAKGSVIDVEANVRSLEEKLENNLLLRLRELTEKEQDLVLRQSGTEERQVEEELKSLRKAVEELDRRIAEVDESQSKCESAIGQLQDEIENLRAQEARTSKEGLEQTKKLNKLLTRRSHLNQTQDECVKKIREIGTLPSDFEKYKQLSEGELFEQLENVQEKLKKFVHINKKALNQYEQAIAKRSEFYERKKEADVARQSIEELIAHLDMKKDETIHRTFKQVSQNFTAVYEELIPTGFARLRMIRSSNTIEEGEEGGGGGHAEMVYSGIAMDVNFKSKTGDPVPLSHLSGGERSLLALTLIFAIQRCDPAPFYLFDEVDANLDPAHCVAVARMIQRLAHPTQSEEKEVQVVDGEEIVVERSATQFIATSFRQEVVEYFDKIYRTVYSNLVSSIGCVDADAALELLHEAARQQTESE